MNQRIAKITRIATLPPIMALILLILLHDQYPRYHTAAGIVFLTILPLLSYLVWRIVPGLYTEGRPSQRRVAVLFSVIGYVAGLLFYFICHGSVTELFAYLCYVFTGVLIAVSSKLNVKSSGHAAGVAGPVAALTFCKSPWFLLAYAILIPVYISSMELKRHTWKELILGTLYPTVAAVVLFFLLR